MAAAVAHLSPDEQFRGELPVAANLRPEAVEAAAPDKRAVRRTRRHASAPVALGPQLVLARYALRSTVRYRASGRALTGTVIAVIHTDPPTYDIRPQSPASSKRKAAAKISFAVPHDAISGLLLPPPEDPNLIVLSDLPLARSAGMQAAAPQPWRRFLPVVLGMAAAGPG